MKPYSPKRKGSTRGHVSCTSKCATRERAIRRDKKAARRVSAVQCVPPTRAQIDPECAHPIGCIHDWAHGL